MEDFGLSRIEDVWMEEKINENLVDLPDDFYENVVNYALEVKREWKKSQDLRSDLLSEELNHILEMVQEIYLLRILKITDSLFGEEKQNLLVEERKAFDEIKESLENLREEILAPIMKEEMEVEPPEKKSHTLVFMLREISEPITASDMNNYGPFEVGDFANLPKKSADLLINQGLAKRVEVKSADNK